MKLLARKWWYRLTHWKEVREAERAFMNQFSHMSAEMDERGYRLSMSHPAITSIVADLVALMEENKAPNYIEMTLHSKVSYQRFRLLIQREGGETPSEQNTRLKEEIAGLQAKLRKYGLL